MTSPTLCGHICPLCRDDNPAQCFVGFVTRVYLQSTSTRLSWPTGLTLSLVLWPQAHTATPARTPVRPAQVTSVCLWLQERPRTGRAGGPHPSPHVAWVREEPSRTFSEVSWRIVRMCSDLGCHRYQNLGAASFPFPGYTVWGLIKPHGACPYLPCTPKSSLCASPSLSLS